MLGASDGVAVGAAVGGLLARLRAVEATARLLQRARAAKLNVACCYVAYATPDAMPHWKVSAVLGAD